jgi:uncharacterized protein
VRRASPSEGRWKKVKIMPKGFGSLTPERRREISSAGGKAAHAAGTAHRFSSQEAKAAGRIGGLKARKRQLALDALATPPVTYADCPATEPPPPAAPTEPTPAPADPQAALDAIEIQRVYDEAMARS